MVRVSYSLGAVLAGVIVVMLVYGTRSHRVPDATRTVVPADGSEERQSPESVAINSAAGEADRLPNVGRTEDLASAAVEKNEHQNQAGTEIPIDEARRRDHREAEARDVHETYTLLLEELDLTLEEQEELLALLVDVRLSGMVVRHVGDPGPVRLGTPISDAERSDRIAAIIGSIELQRFLVLERNVERYRQTYRIAENLERRGVPLSEAQSDGLFNILVETGGQVSEMRPPSGVELGSREFIEWTLAGISERERHVIALAASVLSPEQVVYLDEIYQRCTYERNYDLQRQLSRGDSRSGGDFRFTWLLCGP